MHPTAALPALAPLLAAWAFVLTLLPATAQDAAQPKLQTLPLKAGMHVIQAEIAQTAAQRTIGMMHRKSMGQNEGMLFTYDEPQVHCFWMRNTLVPLTIAFIADDGRIVNTADMQPLDERSHCAAAPVRFALEMNQGWFAKRALKPGFRLQGAPFKP